MNDETSLSKDGEEQLPLDGEVPQQEQELSSTMEKSVIDIDRILPQGLAKTELGSYSWSDEGFFITVYIPIPEV